LLSLQAKEHPTPSPALSSEDFPRSIIAVRKVTKEAEILQEGFSLILCGEKNFYRTAIYQSK